MNIGQKQAVLPGETIWILGGGKFGLRAARLLRKTLPAATMVMVEQQPVLQLQADIELVCADGVEWFYKNFRPDSPVTRIIPAIPVHLAVEWLKLKLAGEDRAIRVLEIPEKLLEDFPHPIRLGPGKIVMSHADFICPENCTEPEKICSYTGQPRPPSLYRKLETISGHFTPIIVRSRQFAPGVGGFFPEDLWDLLARVRRLPDTPLLVGTACKCHGVVDCFLHERADTNP